MTLSGITSTADDYDKFARDGNMTSAQNSNLSTLESARTNR